MDEQTTTAGVASPCIQEMLGEFLAEQQARLKPRTFRNYDDIVYLFSEYLNGYAYSYLDKAESALFHRLYDAEGDEHREFCDIFGPEKILKNTREFLGYYMVRKVVCGKETLRAAGTVLKKLAAWLHSKGYATAERAQAVARGSAQASRELPLADELGDLLHDCAEPYLSAQCAEHSDGHFVIEKVEPGKLWLGGYDADERVVVSVPREVSDLARVGWSINLVLGKSSEGWRILEVGNVYPL